METLAGDKPAWGEEWGYGRDCRRYYADTADIVPRSQERLDDRADASDPGDFSALLFSTVFWALLIVGVALSWIAR